MIVTNEQRRQIRLLQDSNKCFFYEPYEWQNKLLSNIGGHNISIAAAPNKQGKCLTFQTLIETPNGEKTIGSLFLEGKDFDVYAWDGNKKIIAKAHAPFKKEGIHRCYRITMSDGRWFEAADHHRVLMNDGSYAFVSDLLPFFLGEKNHNIMYIDGNRIISIEKIVSQPVYDCHVEKYHNYFAGGLIHHNTACAANIVISWALGYEPWTRVNSDYPDAVEQHGVFYKPSSLNIPPPVDIVIVGEDWKMHIGRTIIPELKKWCPKGFYTTKKNEQGVEYYFEWLNGSKFNIMCYTQDTKLFESFLCHGLWEDEPAPKDKHAGLQRGLMLTKGKTLMTMTPLSKDAWVLDDLMLANRSDVYVLNDLTILSNPNLVKMETDILKDCGLNGDDIKIYFDLLLYDDANKKNYVSDKGSRASKYLEKKIEISEHMEIGKLPILKFVREIDPSEVAPRLFGQFKALVGKVLKEFKHEVHIIEPFKIPPDYPIIPLIDFHLGTPQAISYWAVSPNDIHFCVAEVWDNISASEVADNIIRRKLEGWNIKEVFIDPLSKGDTSYILNRLGTNAQDSFSIIDDKISRHGMFLSVASKDKDSGVNNLKAMIKGVNGIPTLYIFNTCERHIYEIDRWVFDEYGKPNKGCSDHFMENMYRMTLTGIKYSDYRVKPIVINDGITHWMSA